MRRPLGVSASGFSQKICFRAAAQAITCAGCSECGVASRIAPIVSSARTASRSAVKSRSCRRKIPRRFHIRLDGANDLQPRVVGGGFDEIAAPAAEADNGGVDHRKTPVRQAAAGSPR